MVVVVVVVMWRAAVYSSSVCCAVLCCAVIFLFAPSPQTMHCIQKNSPSQPLAYPLSFRRVQYIMVALPKTIFFLALCVLWARFVGAAGCAVVVVRPPGTTTPQRGKEKEPYKRETKCPGMGPPQRANVPQNERCMHAVSHIIYTCTVLLWLFSSPTTEAQ